MPEKRPFRSTSANSRAGLEVIANQLSKELAEDNPVSPVVRDESASFWCLPRCLLGRTNMPLLEIIKPSHLCFPFVWMRPERWCSRGACEEACDRLGVCPRRNQWLLSGQGRHDRAFNFVPE
jgi:hypothetical protein